ncbi:arsenical resistance protein ArsH [Paracoccus alcaliphilus]|uniref:Arsenical resistance protein ArsH n=1 Tax=Paracoccus alcaliphilus TaxID=34002 RepID=A0A1H8GE42_9RHOB|nr:NADPH-dependent FMN reductase [Paracoccus alcaliphilus]WCR17964.1 NAD(P)H-dependent oxidoreductase [Paracoccus alcaliphilus]SEN42050.1 arsenical resistance protein ArsH [Paracoccus alcaliphilus]
MRLRTLPDPEVFPALDPDALPELAPADPPVRVLVLYGSLRERSFSRLAAEEATRLLLRMGAEARIFDPSDLPFPDQQKDGHPAIAELRAQAGWADAMLWSTPETHGQMSGLLKAQVEHIPLDEGGISPTQGQVLALMQVCGGSQSFNALNNMRVMGRSMRMLTIPHQCSVARVHHEFGPDGRMRAGACYDRIVDLAEELMRLTLLTRPWRAQLADRYSRRAAVRRG